MVWHDSIDEWLNKPMLVVEPGPSRVPLQQVVEAAEQSTGGRAIAVANPRLDDRALGVAIGKSMVYVNPHTGEILGMRIRGTGFAESLMNFHTKLLAGRVGQWITTLSAVGGLLMGLTGLWWPLRIWRVRLGRSWLRFHFDLHAAVGVYFLVLTLLMRWTAVHMSFGSQVDPWMTKLLGGKEAEMVRPVVSRESADNTRRTQRQRPTVDEVAAIGQQQFPEARIRFIQMSNGPKQPFRVQLKQPEDGTPGGRSVALIDSVTGELRGVQDSRSITGGPWLNQYVDAIHTGEIGGWPLRFAYAMACIAISVQSFTGVALWILRRKKTQPATEASSRN